MNLPSELITEFVKVTKTTEKPKDETTVYGTIVEYSGSNYVQLDGSELLTPISTTADIVPGERVTVMIKNHTAMVTGNVTSPAARTDDVLTLGGNVSAFEVVLKNKANKEDVTKATEEAAKTATNFLSYDTEEGLQLGDKSTGSWLGFRTQIKSDSYNILKDDGTVLASYGDKRIALGEDSEDAVISLCKDKGQIEYETEDGQSYLQVHSDKLRLKSDSMSSLYSMYTDEKEIWRKSSINVSPNKVDIYVSECVDPAMVEKIEGWNSADIIVKPNAIDIVVPGNIKIDANKIEAKVGEYVSVEEGTSGIWSYRKFSDGHVDLWGSFDILDKECNAELGSMYRTDVFDIDQFPFTVYNPHVTANYESDGYGAMLWATQTSTTTQPPSYYLIRPTSSTIVSGKIIFRVTGRWKETVG